MLELLRKGKGFQMLECGKCNCQLEFGEERDVLDFERGVVFIFCQACFVSYVGYDAKNIVIG